MLTVVKIMLTVIKIIKIMKIIKIIKIIKIMKIIKIKKIIKIRKIITIITIIKLTKKYDNTSTNTPYNSPLRWLQEIGSLLERLGHKFTKKDMDNMMLIIDKVI